MTKPSAKKNVAGGEDYKPTDPEDAVASPRASLFSRDWFWGLVLVLAVVLVYQPVLHAGFIWDDAAIVTANPVIVGPLGLKEIWTTNAADICPLVLTTFWVEHALWARNRLHITW